MLQAKIVSINVSLGGIPKLPRAIIKVEMNGLEGDGHNHEKHRTPFQAVCIQDVEKLEELVYEGYNLGSGTIGENLTVRGLNVNALPIGTILEFSNGVRMQLTKLRKPCYVLDSINPRLKEDIEGRCGMYAKVLKSGTLTQGEIIQCVLPSESQS